MKLLQKTQSGEELQRFAAAVEEIPQDLAIAIAGRARGSSESAEDSRNVVNKWEVSAAANAMEAVLRASSTASFHGSSASAKAPNAIASSSSPSLCRNRRRRASPSENRNPNPNPDLSKKGSMASSIDQRSGKLTRSISAGAPLGLGLGLGLGLKLSDPDCHGKKVEPFSADSAMESSSSKKTKNPNNSLARPALKLRSPYDNCASAIARNPNASDASNPKPPDARNPNPSDARNPNPSDARNPNPSDARNPNPSEGFNRAFLFEKTPIKKTQLSSRRSSSYGYGERVIIHHSSNRSSTAKKLINPAMASCSSSISARATENPAIAASAPREVRKDSAVLRERRSFRSPSPSRVRSSVGLRSAKTEESHGLASEVARKSCSDGILNRPRPSSSAIARFATVLHSSGGISNRPQAPSSSTIARLIQVTPPPPPASASSSSSSSSAVRSSRKGWDLRPLDSLLPRRRSMDMASSRFSSAPRPSRITHPSSPLAALGRSSNTRIKAENVRASRSICSKSSQIPPSMGSGGREVRSMSNTGARIKNAIASASATSSSSTVQRKQYMSPDNKSSRVWIHDKRWTDGSVSWDSISPSLAALAKEIADFKRSASSAAAQALQEASVAESVLRNVSVFAELCSQSKPESPMETMERYFDFRCSLQLAMNVSMELSKSCQKKHPFEAFANDQNLDIKEKKADSASSYKERLQCAASWVSAAIATDLVQVSEYAHQSNVESMKASKITGNSIGSRRDSIDVSETISSTKSSNVRGSCKAVGSDAMTRSQVFPSKTLLQSPGRLMLRPASPATQRRMSYTPVRSGKRSAKSHNNNRIAPASSSSGEIFNDANTLSRKDALDIVSSLFPQSSTSHDCSTQTGLALNGITASARSLLQGEDGIKADNIAALAMQLQTESQKWFFSYMEKALDCGGLKFLYTEPARKESRPYSDNNRGTALGLSDNEALASAFPHLKQLNDWIGTLDYGTLDAKMLEVLSRLKKKICHFLLQHIKTANSNSNLAQS